MKRILALTLSLAACGGPDRSSGSAGSSPREAPAVDTREAPLVRAHRSPEQIRADGAAAASLAVQAVDAASALAGRGELVTYGTVAPSAEGYAWRPEPADRIILQLEDARYEISIHSFRGDLSSPDAFLTGAHLLDATVDDGAGPLRLRSSREGSSRTVEVEGHRELDGVAYQVDLTAAGTERFENDSTGAEYVEGHQVSGTIDWPGAHLVVDETWDFELVSAGRSASSAVRTVRSRLEADGHHFVFEGVRLKKAFRDGAPTEIDTFWDASGRITEDGAPFGLYRLDQSGAAFIEVLLQLPDRTLEIESYRID